MIPPDATALPHTLIPIAAHDILPDGTTRPVEDPWPAPGAGPGAAWRWRHCNRADPAFVAWATENLPAAVRLALTEADSRPRCDTLGEGLVVALRGINLNPGETGEDMVALRAWVAPGLVVTTRLRRIVALDDLHADVAADRAPPSPGAFLVRLTDVLLRRIEEVAANREERTDTVEEMLLDDEPDRIGAGETEIARLARSGLKLRRHIAPQRAALARMARTESALIADGDRAILQHLSRRAERLVEELDMIRDRLAALRGHVDSLNAARIGRNGFVLSVVAAIFLPLGFVTSLLGVNLGGMPGTNHPWGFWILACALAAAGLGLWLLFRRMKWF